MIHSATTQAPHSSEAVEVEKSTVKILMVIAMNNTFVGKCKVFGDKDLLKSDIILDDTVEVTKIMTQNGIVLVFQSVGRVTFNCEDLIVCELDSKSAYFIEYYKNVSGLSVVPTMLNNLN